MGKGNIRKSLKYSFLDGTFFSVMFGFGDSYVNPFAIALKATNFQIGLLSSLPGLVSSLAQVRAPEWTEKIGRSRIMIGGVLVQTLLWLPLMFLPHLFPGNPVPWLIAIVTLYMLMASLAGPAWGSIMSQYLPAKKRGQYFSWRQRIHGMIALVATLAAGFILFLFPRESVRGFMILFGVAFVCRSVSWYYLTRMYEPPVDRAPRCHFTLWDFISRARKSNFAKFVFFVGLTSFAVNLSGPFFSVYMLRELRFDYLSFVVVNAAVTVATLLSLPAWGKHADRVGNLKVIRFTSLLIPLIPVLWLVSSAKPFLILIQVLSGFAWGGFNLAVSNFIFDAVSEGKRVRCLSYFNLINGLGVFFGATLGGYVITHLPAIDGSKILTIFLISGVLRLVIRLIFVPKLREVRTVEEISYRRLFFSVTGIKPIMGVTQDSLRIE